MTSIREIFLDLLPPADQEYIFTLISTAAPDPIIEFRGKIKHFATEEILVYKEDNPRAGTEKEKIYHVNIRVASATLEELSYEVSLLISHDGRKIFNSRPVCLGYLYYSNIIVEVQDGTKVPTAAAKWNRKTLNIGKTYYQYFFCSDDGAHEYDFFIEVADAAETALRAMKRADSQN